MLKELNVCVCVCMFDVKMCSAFDSWNANWIEVTNGRIKDHRVTHTVVIENVLSGRLLLKADRLINGTGPNDKHIELMIFYSVKQEM